MYANQYLGERFRSRARAARIPTVDEVLLALSSREADRHTPTYQFKAWSFPDRQEARHGQV